MNYNQFLQTIDEFNQGDGQFNHGTSIDAFLFNNKWYPVKAFVNQALTDNSTTHEAIKKVVSLIPYIRIKEDVDFSNSNNLPISLTDQEKMEELRILVQRMNDLVYS